MSVDRDTIIKWRQQTMESNQKMVRDQVKSIEDIPRFVNDRISDLDQLISMMNSTNLTGESK